MHFNLWTFALQTINFLVLLWLLQRFLYRPGVDLIGRRQALVAKDFAEARAARDAAESVQRTWEERLSGVAAERERQLAAARTDLDHERRQLLEKAGAEADALHAAGLRRLEEERTALADRLSDQVVGLGVDLARTLLAPLGQATLVEAMLAEVSQRLAGLPPERRAALGEAPIEIATMPALDDPTRDHWRSRLTELLSADRPADVPPVEFSFVTDPALLTGTELRGAGLIIGFSWRDSLARARATMAAAASIPLPSQPPLPPPAPPPIPPAVSP